MKGMDVLADALAAMRIGQSRSARTEVHAPWGLRFPAAGGAGFHVVLSGSCWLLPESGAQPTPLGRGDVVFLRNGAAHSLADDPASPVRDFAPTRWAPRTTIGRVEIDGPGERALLICGAYQLSRSRPHPLLGQLPEILRIPADRARHTGLHATVELLAAELEEHRPGRDGVVPALIDAMLLLVLRAWAGDAASQDTATPGWAAALTDPSISAALTAVHEDPAHPWTVAKLGARCGLSRSAFAQRFTALVGTPPLTYLTWWRMTTAGRLLGESDAPLSAVAEQVGYSSEFAFAKAFKREFGIAPGRYRRAPSPAAG
jgi:AraC-like DNA-binding protein